MNAKKVFQFVVLSLMLAGLPLLSWYYLKKGFNYRKEVLDDLGNYARLTDLPSLPASAADTLLRASSLRDHLVVWAMLPTEDSIRERMTYYLGEFHEQFGERPEVQYLLLPTAQDSASFRRDASGLPLDDPAFLIAAGADSRDLAGPDKLDLPAQAVPLSQNPYLALTDSLVVRRYYDVRKPEDMKRLVEHIAVLLPVEGSKTEIKREPEK